MVACVQVSIVGHENEISVTTATTLKYIPPKLKALIQTTTY